MSERSTIRASRIVKSLGTQLLRIADTRWWMLGSLGLMAVSVGLLLSSGWGTREFGTLSSWFAAVGTVGALSVTATTYLKAERRHRQTFAERVTAIVNDRPGDEWMVTLYNRSGGPIFDVVVTVEALVPPYGPVGVDRWWCLGPDDHRLTEFVRSPAFGENRLPEVSSALAQVSGERLLGFNFGAGIRFRDQSGRAWHRAPTGALIEISNYDLDNVAAQAEIDVHMWQCAEAGYSRCVSTSIPDEIRSVVVEQVASGVDGTSIGTRVTIDPVDQ